MALRAASGALQRKAGVAGEGSGEGRPPPAPTKAAQCVAEGGEGRVLEAKGLANRTGQGAVAHARCEVEQGALDRRDRDVAERGGLAAQRRAAKDVDSVEELNAATAGPHDGLDRWAYRKDTECAGSGDSTERASGGSERELHPVAVVVATKDRGDGEDALPHPYEPTGVEAVVERPLAAAELPQLSNGDPVVLGSGYPDEVNVLHTPL